MNDICNNWIYNLFHPRCSKKQSSFYISLRYFVLPPAILFAYPLITRWNHVTHDTFRIIAMLLASLWTFLGPIMINKFYEGYKTFRCELGKYFTIGNDGTRQITEQVSFFRRITPYIIFLWIGIGISIFLCSPESLIYYGVWGYSDIWFWIFLLYIGFLLYLTSIGISNLIISLYLIVSLLRNLPPCKPNFSSCSIPIKIFSNFSFLLCKCFSSGVLYLPILIHFLSHGSNGSNILTILLTSIYSLALLISVALPYFMIRSYAENRKQELKESFELKYRNLLTKSFIHGSNFCPQLETKLDLIILNDTMNYIDKIDTNPLSFLPVLHLLCLILSPIFVNFIPFAIDFIPKLISFF